MSTVNKAGLSYSYSKDSKDSKLSRQLWNHVGIKTSLQNTKSNFHWIECDNLETMLKTTSVHNAERLTHFLTSQLEYIPGQNLVLDIFERQKAHNLGTEKFLLNDVDKAMHLNFLKTCADKAVELQTFLSCDDVIAALAESSENDNYNMLPPSINLQNMPSERLLMAEHVFPKSDTVYQRMEKLCSSSNSDVKTLLDLTASDYGLDELCYIPCVAKSPFLFASGIINEIFITANSQKKLSLPPMYFIPWGFVEHSVRESTVVKIPNTAQACTMMVKTVIEKLKDQKDGLFAVTNLMESIVVHASSKPLDSPAADTTIFSIILAELLRKQGYLDRSKNLLLAAYNNVFKIEKLQSSLFAKLSSTPIRQLCDSLLINSAKCCIQLGSVKQCLDILNEIAVEHIDIIDTYHYICAISLASCALAFQGRFALALEKAEVCCKFAFQNLPVSHTILSSVINQLAVILATNKKYRLAIVKFEEAQKIIRETTGLKSMPYVLTSCNTFLVECVTSKRIQREELEKNLNYIQGLLPANHNLRNVFTVQNIESMFEQLSAEAFIWKLSFVSLLDHPFSWIDFPPSTKAVVFGADYQVWAHIDNLLHLHP